MDVALKEEKSDKNKKILKFEYEILKDLQGLSRIPKIYDFIENSTQNFIVMELLGENVANHKKNLNDFTEINAYDILLQMIETIKLIHDKGYLHRDIKPTNFVMSRECPEILQKTVYMVDFGLSKVHLDKNGKPFPPRQNTDFRGTLTYASLNAHLKKELSRRDDLWSFFFVILDLLNEDLPWRKCKDDKDEIRKRKEVCLHNPEKNLFLTTTKGKREIYEILNHLKSLKYEDRPDYDLISNKIRDMRSKELTRIFQQGYSNNVFQDHILFDFLRLKNHNNKQPIQDDFQNIQQYYLDHYKNNNVQNSGNHNINIFNNSFNNNLNNQSNHFSNILSNLSGFNSNNYNQNNPNFKNEIANANLNNHNMNLASLDFPQIANNGYLFSNNINNKNNNLFPNVNRSHFPNYSHFFNNIGNYDFNITNNDYSNLEILKNIYMEQIQLESNQRLKIAELLNLKNQKNNLGGNKAVNNDSMKNQKQSLFCKNYDNFFISKENNKEDKFNDNNNIPVQENNINQSQYLNIPEINSINNQDILINSNNDFIQLGNCKENDSPNNNYFLNDKIHYEKIESVENYLSNLSNNNLNSNLNLTKNSNIFNKEILFPNCQKIITDELNINANDNNDGNYENLTKKKRARDNCTQELNKEEKEKSVLGNNTISNSLLNKKLNYHNNEDSNNKANKIPNSPFIETIFNKNKKNTNTEIENINDKNTKLSNNHQNQIFIINQFSKNNNNITDLEKELINYFLINHVKNSSTGVNNNQNILNPHGLNNKNNNNYKPVDLNGQSINNYYSENIEKLIANLIKENLVNLCIQKYLKNLFDKNEHDFKLNNCQLKNDNRKETNILMSISEILQENNNQYMNAFLNSYNLLNSNGKETINLPLESQLSAILNKCLVTNNQLNNVDLNLNNLNNIFENNFFNTNNIPKTFHPNKTITNDLYDINVQQQIPSQRMGSNDAGYNNNNLFNLPNLISNNPITASNINPNKIFHEIPYTPIRNNSLNNLIKKESLENFDFEILKNDFFSNLLRNEENIKQKNLNIFSNETTNNILSSKENYLNLLKNQNFTNFNYNNNKNFKSPMNNLNLNLNENNHINFNNFNNPKNYFNGDFKTLEKELELNGCSLNKNLITNLENLKNQNNLNDSNYLLIYNILTGRNNLKNYFNN